jgi:hypothetical protein
MDTLKALSPDADPCCKRVWARLAMREQSPTGHWECPKCGQEYRPETVGRILIWRAYTWVARI